MQILKIIETNDTKLLSIMAPLCQASTITINFNKYEHARCKHNQNQINNQLYFLCSDPLTNIQIRCKDPLEGSEPWH